ncbi:hypothetical protein [Burkholderia vietnamiensis]|uniref:hypothetical protein n=1 Tax=Burkholderia vietnamiensis TaxID=60552 RepID=UPI001CF472F1|nr:hypothetical protein [Burkholderia vietnamiensis]MCA8198535.1 hypothetical protein [Burkholderia vietnamiensis]
MESQKDFVFLSKRIIACVDFLKWTSTFGEGTIGQVEEPMRGMQISPAMSDLFGFARDEVGLMLAMDASEAPWLEDLPVSAAIHGYDRRPNLLLVTEATPVMDLELPQMGIEIYVPLSRQPALETESLLGFCLVRNGAPERVGRIVPLHTPESWASQRRAAKARSGSSGSFFAAS